MNKIKSFKENIFKINAENFEENAFKLFNFQAKNNPIYKQYIHNLHINVEKINKIDKIPFLPIEFFKTQIVKTEEWEPQAVFESSGTTGQSTSKHYIEDLAFYSIISRRFFEDTYGALRDYAVIALLPSYLERNNSSLVVMVAEFMKESQTEWSGFYLDNLKALSENLIHLANKSKPIILIGVSFALLDLAESFQQRLSNVVVMETGGMKGRREELTREALHTKLKNAFEIGQVHSEYGMTELLSQAYARENGLFQTPPWMKVMIREINDPFHFTVQRQTGGVNIIDLANIHSCAFIETQDVGKMHSADTFEILGRFDNSDIRGCNLLSIQ